MEPFYIGGRVGNTGVFLEALINDYLFVGRERKLAHSVPVLVLCSQVGKEG